MPAALSAPQTLTPPSGAVQGGLTLPGRVSDLGALVGGGGIPPTLGAVDGGATVFASAGQQLSGAQAPRNFLGTELMMQQPPGPVVEVPAPGYSGNRATAAGSTTGTSGVDVAAFAVANDAVLSSAWQVL